MSARFQELAWEETPIGTISLRQRHDPTVDADVFEVKLDDEYLMSSLFTAAEVELAHLGLGAVDGGELDVLVGGLGLGYTAQAVLPDQRVRTLTVVDALGAVIGWHQDGLLPVSDSLTSDPRTRLVHDDFFAMMRGEPDPEGDGPTRFHAILLDVDHSPRHVLSPSHADLYTAEGLRALQRHLAPGGVFALWSDDPPDEEFLSTLGEVFAAHGADVVSFDNPLTRGRSANTIYVAT